MQAMKSILLDVNTVLESVQERHKAALRRIEKLEERVCKMEGGDE